MLLVVGSVNCQTFEQPIGYRPSPLEIEPEGPSPLAQLEATGTSFRSAPVKEKTTSSGLLCGITDGVAVVRGSTGIRYRPLPHVSAAFAVRLATFEQLVQETAGVWMNSRVVRIEHLGTYACRKIAGARSLSEHARGNAIDVATFIFANGSKVSVRKDFVRAEGVPQRRAEKFLRDLVTRTREERTFGVVLTPDWDDRHHDHLHLDGSQLSRWHWLFS